MNANVELLKELKAAPRARFYLCDLHVHSPASADVRASGMMSSLSSDERSLIESIAKGEAKDPVKYETRILGAFPVARYHELLVARRDGVAAQEGIQQGEDWAFVAITDHNVCGYAAELSMFAWKHRHQARLVVLPGLELDVCFPVSDGETAEAHVLFICQPGAQPSDVRIAIRDLARTNWNFGETAQVASLPKFVRGLRAHADYPAIAIAAHVSSGKGVRGAARQKREELTFTALEAAVARTLAELDHSPDADRDALNRRLEQLRKQQAEQISLDVLRLLGACGFDGLQVSCKEDEVHYRRLHRFHPSFGRAVPLVASDAHSIGQVFSCESNAPYLKLPIQAAATTPEETFARVRHALRYGETRFSYCTPGQVRSWIAGIEISPDAEDAAEFWPYAPDGPNGSKPFVLPLSRNLNSLIGGRGSGKSAAIEAIAFVAEPDKFLGKNRKRDDGLPDWYKRARATLRGCQVRLVWQSVGTNSDLPKGTTFASRYFNPTGEHPEVGYATLEGKEILGSALTLEPVQLFRARDIENAAEPVRLRELFDTLVGERIPQLKDKIADLLKQLADQREEMVDIARRLSELTRDDTPLREYARRKSAYEAANRPAGRPLYKHLDEASAADALAKDARNRWAKAVAEVGLGSKRPKVGKLLDSLSTKIRDKDGRTKPFCEAMAKIFEKGKDGRSARDRLDHAFTELGGRLAKIGEMLDHAAEDTASHHRKARETLVQQGLPPGAKDRAAKKSEFEKAEEDLDEYRNLVRAWDEQLKARDGLFEELVGLCKERTKLRSETAVRVSAQLRRDLDASVLVIELQVHPMEDRTALQQWLLDNVGHSIPKSREARVNAIVEKGILPKDVRDCLLNAKGVKSSVFRVDKAKASEGKVEARLAEAIANQCAGRARLDLEHLVMKEGPSAEFVQSLPKDIRTGLWAFPPVPADPSNLIVDSVLVLDEVVFDDRPKILLNDRPLEKGSALRPIDELSPGQRCSAILPILLLNGGSPLIIDQPEDNLDNRLIRQVIVNILASIKLRRQVIVATHNPNLPVLGDVEQAIVLRAIEERQAKLESTGDLDSSETVVHLTEIMEGGREAFQYRQSIYQAHWAGPVADGP